jgi:hypothetical protein
MKHLTSRIYWHLSAAEKCPVTINATNTIGYAVRAIACSDFTPPPVRRGRGHAIALTTQKNYLLVI